MAGPSNPQSILRQLLMTAWPSRHGLDLYFDPIVVLRDLNFPYPHPQHIVTTDDDSPAAFKVMFNVRHFSKHQIKVQIQGRTIKIICSHPATVDAHGQIDRRFERRLDIPDGIDPSKITAELAYSGILILQAPSASPESPTVASRIIPLVMQAPIDGNPANLQYQEVAGSIPIPIQRTDSASAAPIPTQDQPVSVPIQREESAEVPIEVEPAASESVPIHDDSTHTGASPQRMEES